MCVALLDVEGDAPRRAVSDYISKLEVDTLDAACDLAAVWFGVDLVSRCVDWGRCWGCATVSVPVVQVCGVGFRVWPMELLDGAVAPTSC